MSQRLWTHNQNLRQMKSIMSRRRETIHFPPFCHNLDYPNTVHIRSHQSLQPTTFS